MGGIYFLIFIRIAAAIQFILKINITKKNPHDNTPNMDNKHQDREEEHFIALALLFPLLLLKIHQNGSNKFIIIL